MCKGKKKLYVISYGNQLFREALPEGAGSYGLTSSEDPAKQAPVKELALLRHCARQELTSCSVEIIRQNLNINLLVDVYNGRARSQYFIY